MTLEVITAIEDYYKKFNVTDKCQQNIINQIKLRRKHMQFSDRLYGSP